MNETDEYGYTGLHLAAEHGHLKVVEELMVKYYYCEKINEENIILIPGWGRQAGSACV